MAWGAWCLLLLAGPGGLCVRLVARGFRAFGDVRGTSPFQGPVPWVGRCHGPVSGAGAGPLPRAANC
jgi:hypothetical protein